MYLAIAVLWIEFVREIRWYWEESQPLPKMPVNGFIDLSTCLINQKLQMVSNYTYLQKDIGKACFYTYLIAKHLELHVGKLHVCLQLLEGWPQNGFFFNKLMVVH